ncbi:MAG: HAMP domain-containing sensor histidine kinase [Eubacteriales bacterium]|nr:HAMP domain-containing sensor histidine kinase [Eubacteriales bacterium]
MGKIKEIFRKQSIRKSFVIHLVVCLAAAFLLSLFSSAACQWGINKLEEKYEDRRDSYTGRIVTESSGEELGSMYYYTKDIEDFYTDADKLLDKILDIMSFVVVPVWFVICIAVTSAQFYRRNLKKPLAVLDAAASEIARQNLDFEVYYEKNDEMGRLCDSFEKMRLALRDNNREMWRQMEERKRLNAAFSHDLRTPLTVLKGQSEMLVKYVPEGKMTQEKIVATAQTMRAHISRLEEYVQTMNRIQKLEDLEVRAAKIPVGEIVSHLKESAGILCRDKKFILHTAEERSCLIPVDLSFVLQVCENLLSNAVRYAKSQVTVKISAEKELRIKFCDDGVGFSNKEINEVVRPFYRGEQRSQRKQQSRDGQQPREGQNPRDGQQPRGGQNTRGEQSLQGGHLGMGLYICKIICEKHKGRLLIENSDQGAAVTAVFGFYEK